MNDLRSPCVEFVSTIGTVGWLPADFDAHSNPIAVSGTKVVASDCRSVRDVYRRTFSQGDTSTQRKQVHREAVIANSTRLRVVLVWSSCQTVYGLRASLWINAFDLKSLDGDTGMAERCDESTCRLRRALESHRRFRNQSRGIRLSECSRRLSQNVQPR